MFFGLRDGLHQVHPLSVDLDQRQYVPVLHGVVQNLHSGRGVMTKVLSKALLCVLGRDVVFPRLPGDRDAQRWTESTTGLRPRPPVDQRVTHMSLLGSGLVTSRSDRAASMISLKLAFPTFFAN